MIRFDAADGSSIIVQPNDVETIDRLCQDESLTVRARLTVRQYKWREKKDDLFAPASVPVTARVIDTRAVKKGWPTFTADASRAFWQVPQDERCVVRPPPQWLEKHVANGGNADDLWLLKRWLYGQRRAPQAYTDWHAKCLTSLGFMQDVACPVVFVHPENRTVMEVHADDSYGTGPPAAFREFKKSYMDTVKCKTFAIHGLGATYEHLRRKRVRTPAGMWLIPNMRHLDNAQRQLGMVGC